jgi:hypothetical protein
MPANNTTHDHTSIHSQQEETRRKCQCTWKSLAFPPPDLLKAHTQQHQKEKIKHLQRLRPLPSDKQRLKSTPNITSSPSQQKNNKKKETNDIYAHGKASVFINRSDLPESMQLQRNNSKRKSKKATTLSLFLHPTSSLSLSLSPPLFASNLLLLLEKRPKKLSGPAEAPPRLSHTTSLSSEIKTVTTLHTISLFLLTTLLTNINNSHKSHKHKPNERTTEEPTNKQHPENTSPQSPPQLQTKPNPKISHTSKKNLEPATSEQGNLQQ